MTSAQGTELDRLSVLTLNTNGIRSAPKRRALFTKLRNMKADFIMLQEIHSTPNEEKIWCTEWGALGVFSHGVSNSRGVCILFNKECEFKVVNTIKDDDGRFLIIQVEYVGGNNFTPSRTGELWTLVNIYAPTSNEPVNQSAVMAKVYNHLANLEIHSMVIGGDMNVQLDGHNISSEPHTATTLGPRNEYVCQIQAILEEYNLTDIWKVKHPTSKKGTFHRNKYSARLDYIFAPEFLVPSVTSISIHPEPLSDHCIVSVKIDVSSVARGPGFWRFDNALLSDEAFVQEMRNIIAEALEENLENPNTAWEWTKYKVREFCISYVVKRNREQKAMVSTLEKRLQYLLDSHNLSDSSDVVAEVQSIRRELAEILQEKANKTIFKAKAHWTQLGEKPSSYFLGLEKRVSKNKCITSMKNGEGHILTNPSDILAYERQYFSEIYEEEPSLLQPIHEFPISQEDIPQVSEAHRYMNNTPFTHRDFHQALKELNTNKSPGTDGLTPKFYLAFWDLLQFQFYDSIIFSMEQGSLSQEQRAGIITLIPKKDQDRLLLNNWRPITLLNADTKIFSKAVANRLQSCIQDVVDPDQTGFIRGRTIGTNLTNIQMVIDHTKVSSSKGIIAAVDYRKAFDTIRWDLIHHAISVFGFGEYISTAVRLLFENIRTCVFNNGFSSQYIYPSRGIRQGCCSSPSIFVIAVELLALMIRKSIDIKGIQIADRHITISQYADDATFFVQDFASLHNLLRLLDTFASFSGLNINYHKSYLLLLGHHLDPPTQCEGIRITDQVKILGITFKNDMDEDQNYRLNFQPQIKKIQKVCSTWSNRTLSMKGKVLLISALMTSVLQYQCSNTTTPVRAVIEYKKIITNFFWSDKRGKVAYRVLIQDIPDGGIKLPDLNTRIQSTHLYWIKYLWKHPDSIMASVLKYYLGINDIRSIIMCKTNVAARLPNQCSFLRAIFNTWAKLHIHEPAEEPDVLMETIWNNDFIRIQQHTVTWNRWSQAGIIHINDLLHPEQSRFMSHAELGDAFGIPISFLDLLQIRSAIPSAWKRKISLCIHQELSQRPTIVTADSTITNVLGKSSKTLYYLLVKLLKPVVTSQLRWNELFPRDPQFQHEYWSAIYRTPYKCARDTKLQAFHFRIVHRFLPCNRFLRNIRIKREDTCSYCPAPDTIEHFLFYCPIVVTFWKEVVAWFERESDIHLGVSLRAFLFGVPDSTPNSTVINFVLLFVKFFIYRQKLFHQGNLDLTHLLREFKTRLQVECYLTKIENKKHHFRKWRRTYAALG